MYTGEKPDLDELMHFGVKGMRWGVRNFTRNMSINAKNRTLSKYQNDLADRRDDFKTKAAGIKASKSIKTSGVDLDINSFKPFLKTGLKTKNGTLVMRPEDVRDVVAGLQQRKAKIIGKLDKKQQKYEAKAQAYSKAVQNVGKARKLVDGMTTKEAAAAMQDKLGWSKADKFVMRVGYSPQVNLLWSAAIYANSINK